MQGFLQPQLLGNDTLPVRSISTLRTFVATNEKLYSTLFSQDKDINICLLTST